MILAHCLWIAMAGHGYAAGYTSSSEEIETGRWIVEEVYEAGLTPDGRDVLSKTREAHRLARETRPASSSDEAALKALAQAYNEHFNSSLHHLRNMMERAIIGTDTLSLNAVAVDTNARLGKKSEPVSKDDPSLRKPGNFGPARPSERRLMEDLRLEAISHGRSSRADMDKAREILASIERTDISTSAATALGAMEDAVSVSSAALTAWLEYLAEGGVYAAALDAYQRHLEAANAAVAIVPEVRAEAIRRHNEATREVARLEFLVGDDVMVGRNIHEWLNEWGPL